MMQQNETPGGSHLRNPVVSHELSDVSVRGIVVFGIGLLLAAAVIHVSIWWLMVFLEHREVAREPKPSPMARGRQHLPPEPRLQLAPGHDIHPEIEIKQLREREREMLDNYAWIDPASGVVRIPIERAKELLAQRGETRSRGAGERGSGRVGERESGGVGERGSGRAGTRERARGRSR